MKSSGASETSDGVKSSGASETSGAAESSDVSETSDDAETPEPSGAAAAEDSEEEKEEEEEKTQHASFPEPPRELRRALEDAQKLMEMQRFAEAVHKIDQILGTSEEYFVPKGKNKHSNQGLYYNLKREAEMLLESLPPQGVEAYETEFGTIARLALEDALAQGNMELAAQTAKRYFFSQAGSEAAFLVGMYFMDKNQPTAAMEKFQKLYEFPRLGMRFEPVLTLYFAASCFAAGAKDEALQILHDAEKKPTPQWNSLALGGKTPASQVTSGNLSAWLQEQFPVLESYLPSDTLQNWRLMLQNTARSSDLGTVSLPVMTPCWRVPTIDDPEGSAMLFLLQQKQEEEGFFATHAPLVVGETVLMRTAWNLMAIHLSTGKRLWAVPSPGYAEIKKNLAHLAETNSRFDAGLSGDKTNLILMASLLNQKMWSEAIYGTLSSNGKYVFCIEDTMDRLIPSEDSLLSQRFTAPAVQLKKVQNPNNPPLAQNADSSDLEDPQTVPNRLACYDIQSGKLLWHAGGNAAQWNLPAKGTMFLGAPLVAGNVLYIIGQREGLVRLFAFSTETGEELWTQTLSLIPAGRNGLFLTCTPRLCDGILVCPTPSLALVAVDSATHTLLWGNMYGSFAANDYDAFGYDSPSAVLLEDVQKYSSTELVISDGKILYITPNENNLICIEPQTGKILWNANSSSFSCIAAVRNQKVYALDGGNHFVVLSLETGDVVGSSETPALASGRGFRAGDFYFVPMKDGRIVKIDLEKLEIVETADPHTPEKLGNLTPSGRFILSQSATSLECFVQQSEAMNYVAEIQKTDPKSPEALEIQALLCWKAGDIAQAVRLLKSGGVYTRGLLKLALIESLRIAVSKTPSATPTAAPTANPTATPTETPTESTNADAASEAEFEAILAQMDTPREKIQCFESLVVMLEREKQPAKALEKVMQMQEIFDTISAPAAESEPPKDAAERTSFLPSEIQFTMPFNPSGVKDEEGKVVGEGVQLFYQPDLWLGTMFERLLTQLDAQDPQVLALKKTVESRYSELHAQMEELAPLLSTKIITLETRKKTKALTDAFWRFQTRFRFWDKMNIVQSEYQKLLELQKNYAALEAFVQSQEPTPAAAAARLLLIYERLQEPQLVLAYARYLKREFPGEMVLEGKTVVEWQNALPADSWVLERLTRDDTPFPMGKIIVAKSEKRGPNLQISRASFNTPSWNPGIQLFKTEGVTMTQGDPQTVLCEDNLGECLLNISPVGSSSDSLDSPWSQMRTSQMLLCGTKYVSTQNITTSVFFTMGKQAEIDATESVSPEWTYIAKPIEEPYVEPYLKPFVKQLQDENLEIFKKTRGSFSAGTILPTSVVLNDDSTSNYYRLSIESGALCWTLHNSAILDCRLGTTLASGDDLVSLSFPFNSFLCLLPTAQMMLLYYDMEKPGDEKEGDSEGDSAEAPESVEDVKNVKDAEDSGDSEDAEGAGDAGNAEDAGDSDDSDDSQSEKEGKKKFAPIPENFVPYQIFKNVPASRLLEIKEKLEKQKELKKQKEKDEKQKNPGKNAGSNGSEASNVSAGSDGSNVSDSSNVSEASDPLEKAFSADSFCTSELYFLDSKTGTLKSTQSLPFQNLVGLWETKLLMCSDSNGIALYDTQTKVFDWILVFNPEITKSFIPYFLDSQYVDFNQRLYMLNWKHQIEILDCRTGDVTVAEFPPLDPTLNLKGAIHPLETNSPYFSQKLWILEDENGAFTAVVSFENFEEMPKPESLKPKESKKPDDSEGSDDSDDSKDSKDSKDSEEDGSAEDEDSDVEKDLEKEKAQKQSKEESDEMEFENPDANEILAPDDLEHIPLNHGVLCHFDGNGKADWTHSHFENHTYLVINLAKRIPVLGLMHREVSTRSGSRASGISISVKFLDRRCGRLIYDIKESANSMISLIGNPKTKSAEFFWDNSRIEFRFTDEPYDENDVVVADPRPAILAEITIREREIQSSERYLKGRTEEVEREKKLFEQKTDTSDEDKKFFKKYIDQQEKELNDHKIYLEKERKIIDDLRAKLKTENERHPNTPPVEVPKPQEKKES